MLSISFGESIMNKTQVQLGYNRFKKGWVDVNDNARPVRPSTSTIDENMEHFFDRNGVVHHELLPQSRTVDKEYFLEVKRRLREAS